MQAFHYEMDLTNYWLFWPISWLFGALDQGIGYFWKKGPRIGHFSPYQRSPSSQEIRKAHATTWAVALRTVGVRTLPSACSMIQNLTWIKFKSVSCFNKIRLALQRVA